LKEGDHNSELVYKAVFGVSTIRRASFRGQLIFVHVTLGLQTSFGTSWLHKMLQSFRPSWRNRYVVLDSGLSLWNLSVLFLTATGVPRTEASLLKQWALQIQAVLVFIPARATAT